MALSCPILNWVLVMFFYFSCGLSRLPHITVIGAAHRFSAEDVGTNLFPSQPGSGHKAALFLAFIETNYATVFFFIMYVVHAH